MTVIENKTYDEERALYGSRHVTVKHCAFDGPADGESAFKESADITAIDCFFNLRYPFWHVHGLRISGCEMTPLCRAALWYSDGILIDGHQAAWYQGTEGMLGCDNEKLRYNITGIRLVVKLQSGCAAYLPKASTSCCAHKSLSLPT